MKTSTHDAEERAFSYVFEPLRPFLRGSVVPVAILLLGFAVAKTLLWLQVEPPRTQQEQKPLLVETITVAPAKHSVLIQGFGVVESRKMLQLRPQVSGYVVTVHPAFEKGGQIKLGEILFSIDPQDYEIAVESARASVSRAEFELQVEQGNKVVAEREWKLLKKNLPTSKLGESLALRDPHLKQKQSALLAAQSLLKKAQLDLERTKVTAPFDLLVIKEMVEQGQFVSAQSSVAELAATDEFYVTIKIPQSSLRWLTVPGDVTFRNQPVTILAPGSEADISWSRTGNLVRVLGNVEQSGRMAQLLISVSEPLQMLPGKPALLLGSYVRALVPGIELADVIKIPRTALQEGDFLWAVTKERVLKRVPVKRVFSQQGSFFVRTDRNTPLQVVTTPIRNALEGALVATERELMEKESEDE